MPSAISKRGLPKTPRRTYTCSWPGCIRRFDSAYSVNQHVKERHTKERPEVCVSCGKRFTRPYTLCRHLWKLHGIDARPGAGHSFRVKKPRQLVRSQEILAETRESQNGVAYKPEAALSLDQRSCDGCADDGWDGVSRPASNAVGLECGGGNNFEAKAIGVPIEGTVGQTCVVCHEVIHDPDEMLCHHHMVHEVDFQEGCTCSLCAIFSNGSKQAATQGQQPTMDESGMPVPLDTSTFFDSRHGMLVPDRGDAASDENLFDLDNLDNLDIDQVCSGVNDEIKDDLGSTDLMDFSLLDDLDWDDFVQSKA